MTVSKIVPLQSNFALSFNEATLNASHSVELTMMARDGRFIRLTQRAIE
jgi:hypothetical protein